MELQFESNFCIQFNKVVDIKYLDDDTNDAVIYHYVELINKDVYSVNTDDNVWLEKNIHRQEFLQQD